MSGLLLLFPGQGSQFEGMAEYLWGYPAAREVFAEAEEVLGWDIGSLCRTGTMEELTRTDRTQLTILTCSVAAWRVLEQQGLTFAVAAGHSLGEYSALVATGHMSFADALRVVDVRGRAMQACGEELGGTMAAILGLEAGAVEEICASRDDVWPANYNSPVQIVVSGSEAGVAAAGDAARGRGAKRVLPLAVSGAFHTPFMAGAAESLREALAGVAFGGQEASAGRPEGAGEGSAQAAFFSTTEVRYPAAEELAEVLARQLMSPVRFTQAIQAVMGGADAPAQALEVGPGKVLAGLFKRIVPGVGVEATGDGASLEKALAALASK